MENQIGPLPKINLARLEQAFIYIFKFLQLTNFNPTYR